MAFAIVRTVAIALALALALDQAVIEATAVTVVIALGIDKAVAIIRGVLVIAVALTRSCSCVTVAAETVKQQRVCYENKKSVICSMFF
jgi:hypothetical protein